ncbi:MAG: tRNA (N(6)-L-threonylcarbamoyladenosine(37)-C(2))-methylthiotransferase MtaB, partial [Agathobacter sp.]
MKKAALHNLGCKVNAYETEAMQQMLEEAGYEIVPFTEKADVYVINTCSVTNIADRKSRQMLHRAKHKNPEAVIVAAGCYVQTKEQEVTADKAVDIIIGNNKKHELIERLDEYFAEHGKIDAVIDINEDRQEYEELFMDKPSEHTRAFIKVQDGCNQFCSYCIIPYARGRVRSRDIHSVLDEVNRLAENGYQEVVLTGIHLSSYGIETGESLLHLIQEIHNIEKIKRIRLGSLEPKIVTEEFAQELSKLEKICPHFHLSLQSGCDATLQRMNRKYSAAEYKAGCETLRKYFKHPAITTDVIVGFPGETEEEFEETISLI